MAKYIVLLILVNILMVSGCQSGKPASGSGQKGPEVLLNGLALELSSEDRQALADSILGFMQGADEFYEALVNDRLLESITGSEQYLEIRFSDALVVSTRKFGEMEVSELLIPLSGKFAVGDQLTFFSGKGDLSNTPVISSSGLVQVKEMVKK